MHELIPTFEYQQFSNSMRACMHEYQHLNIPRFEYQQMSTNIFNTKKLLVVSGAEGKHVQKKKTTMESITKLLNSAAFGGFKCGAGPSCFTTSLNQRLCLCSSLCTALVVLELDSTSRCFSCADAMIKKC